MSGTGARRAAIAAEQAHLDRALRRVEALRDRAEGRLAEVQGDRLGSTFAAQFERDVIAHHEASRISRFTLGDREALLFGRIDLTDGESLAIGRLSVLDEDGPVLVDWRAPAAAPFYRATPAQPEGVARRRTIHAEGPRVLDVTDELLDGPAADRLGLEAVTGEGALLAALERTRDHTMRDIVATIQADQDRIIRAPAAGTLVVTGGPGTGKTVVALHRVALLLYRDRERLEARGVLVVGPSRTFTEYTRRVLPSLGEDRVVQRPLEALGPPGLDVVGWDPPAVAAVKGSGRMAAACRRMLASALPPLPPRTRFTVAGTAAAVEGSDLERVRARLLGRLDGATPNARYHARRRAASEALLQALRGAWDEARAAHPTAAADPGASSFAELVVEAPEVRMLLLAFWPDLAAEDVLHPYRRGERHLADVAGDLADRAALDAVHAAWAAAEGWTVEDVAILDELDSLLGPVTPPTEPDEPARPDLGDRWYADFGHVVVDEAQDLSELQWRAVVRRGPYASWTIVGDLAQRARDAAPRTWEEVAGLIGRRAVTIERLDVNYRTPSELAPVARAALAAAGHDPAGFPRTVRPGGRAPRLVVDAAPSGAGLAEALAGLLDGEGTVGVVCAVADRAACEATVAATFEGERAADVRVLDPRRAKGLEFDDLVVVGPERILVASEVGAHDLYVAVTRATRSLAVVTAEPDLPVLAPLAPGAPGAPGVRDGRPGCP
jgi:hypothetical protein